MLRYATLTILAIVTMAHCHAQRVLRLDTVNSILVYGFFALEEYNGTLVVGGSYTRFLGHERRNIQAWNGAAHWDLPGAFTELADRVDALVVHDDYLVAAGREIAFGHIARWDGNTWSSMGQGLPAPQRALAIHQGEVNVAGTDGQVRRWNGSVWVSVGPSLGAPINALCVHEGILYAGGEFTAATSGASNVQFIARFDGSNWTSVGPGLSGTVHVLKSDPEGLLVGGEITGTADGSLVLENWTVFDGNTFQQRPGVPGGAPVTGFHRTTDGKLLVGGMRSTLVMSGSTSLSSFRFTRMHAGIEYGGRTILAGRGNMTSAHDLTPGIGWLAEGTIDADIDLNDVRATIGPFPSTFSDQTSGQPGFEVPKGDGIHAITSTSSFLTAVVNGVDHAFAPRRMLVLDSWPRLPWAGPTAILQAEAFYQRYHRVWKIDRAMVQHHIVNWQDPTYEVPEVIRNWPGNGDTDNGEPPQLAPYVDVDGDGYYDPFSGDHPAVRGDQAVYSIMHAAAVPNWNSLPPLQVDIHSMFHAFHPTSTQALDQTVFVNYRFVNRSQETYEQLRFGQLFDPAIGCMNDDLIGCDSTRSLMYAYNGLEVDLSCSGLIGYGPTPPAQGVLFLNENLRSHSSFRSNVGFMDAMFGTINGQPIDLGGTSTHFMFPGGEHMDQYSPALPDRISVGATGPFTLAPGDTLCIDLAFVHARAGSGVPYTSVELLKLRADSIRAFYEASALDCSAMPVMTSLPRHEQAIPDIRAYPNPASDRIHVTAGATMRWISIRDAQGRPVRDVMVNSDKVTLNISDLARGVYLVQVSMAQGQRTVRAVVH